MCLCDGEWWVAPVSDKPTRSRQAGQIHTYKFPATCLLLQCMDLSKLSKSLRIGGPLKDRPLVGFFSPPLSPWNSQMDGPPSQWLGGFDPLGFTPARGKTWPSMSCGQQPWHSPGRSAKLCCVFSHPTTQTPGPGPERSFFPPIHSLELRWKWETPAAILHFHDRYFQGVYFLS